MNRTTEDMIIINRFDYDELVKKATANDIEIAKEAEKLYIEKKTIPVKIEFYEYRNGKNFSAPISFIRGYYTDEVHDALGMIEPKIKDWMDENLTIYDKKLRDKGITEKNCIGLSKRVTNLEDKLKRYRIKYTFLFSYAAIVSVVVFFLLSLLK